MIAPAPGSTTIELALKIWRYDAETGEKGLKRYEVEAPDWVTLTPDGRSAYVANAGSNSVSVVDINALREVVRIPVGQVPKRNITATLLY